METRKEASADREAWLGPLTEAAERGKGSGRRATLITPWVNADGSLQQQHEPYALCLSGAMGRELPWLPALLRDAGALVYAAPGEFWFELPHALGTRYSVDQMAPHTHFLPWVTPDEAEKPH